MKNSILLLILSISLSFGAKKAFVVGNGDYSGTAFSSLKSTLVDADSISRVLTGMKFKVTPVKNASREQLTNQLRQFANTVIESDTVIFYYSGHGVSLDGQNYLIPSKSSIQCRDDISLNALALTSIEQTLVRRNNAYSIFIIDACRTSSMRSCSAKETKGDDEIKGMAVQTSQNGVVYFFAAREGTSAIGSQNGNGYFTGSLIKYLNKPGYSLHNMYTNVKSDVKKATNGNQIPELDESKIDGDFYFIPGTADNSTELARLKAENEALKKKGVPVPLPKEETPAEKPAGSRSFVVTFEGTPSSAQVLKNGTPMTDFELPAGSYRFTVFATGYQSFDTLLTISGNREISYHLKPKAVSLTVKAVDGSTEKPLMAEVLDGSVSKGTTTWYGTVPATTSRLIVKKEGYLTDTLTLSLMGKMECTVTARLKAKPVAPAIDSYATGYGMKLIPDGTFLMGSTSGDPDEIPVHTVTVSSFYMDSTEVTQKEYRRLMGSNPSNFVGDNKPVEKVSWWDAIKYCNARSRETGLKPVYNESNGDIDWSVKGYRLPTEAEWEYACRAGTRGSYYGKFDKIAWYCENSGSTTHNVATKEPNAFGLYDMSGNVAEWCSDWYSADYYVNSPSNNPYGKPQGVNTGYMETKGRVTRGGSWTVWWGWEAYVKSLCRSSNRSYTEPNDREASLGFRCVLPQ